MQASIFGARRWPSPIIADDPPLAAVFVPVAFQSGQTAAGYTIRHHASRIGAGVAFVAMDVTRCVARPCSGGGPAGSPVRPWMVIPQDRAFLRTG